MSKINEVKISDLDAVRAASVRRGETKQVESNKTSAIENKTTTGADKLQFSGRAEQSSKLLEQVKQLPDVRQEKVGALREQISAGEYNPPAEKIADAILKDETNG